MRKKLKCIMMLLTLTLLLPIQSHAAEKQSTYKDFTYTKYNTETKGEYIVINGYEGQEETVIIPETIDGVTVTSILDMEEYKYPEKIKKVVIPKTIDALGCTAFEKLTNLESIEVDKDNAKYYAKDGVLFSKYKKKTTLEFYPAAKAGDSYTVPSNVNEIAFAFWNNKNIKTLTIKAKITAIYEIANGSNIEKIVLPDSVKYVGEYAFRGCEKLKKIQFGSNVRSIAEYAFQGCQSLKSITIPDSVTEIDKDAFNGCKAKVTKPSYLKKTKKGSYVAKAKIGKKEYNASSITKIAAAKKSYTVKKGKNVKLNTNVYVNKAKKGILSNTSLLRFQSSNKKVLTVSRYGNMKGIKRGKATVTVRLKTGDVAYKVQVTVK